MPDLPETRQSLLMRLSGAEQDTAWATFLDIYEPAIFRFAMSRGLQEFDARDVTQQVLLAVHKRIDTWDQDEAKGSFRGWLFRVTRNLASKQLRQARRQKTEGRQHEFDELPATATQDTSVFVLEYRRQVFRWAAKSVKDQFKQQTWTAFWKTSIGAESAANVASELGMTVGAVYAAKCRVMVILREVVEELTESEFEIEGQDNG